jgi:hypothetical protein
VQQAWHDIAAHCHAGVLCRADRIFLEYAANILAQVRKEGPKVTPRLGLRLEAVLARLGMTPSDRSRVSAAPQRTPDDEAEDEFSRKVDEFRR